MGYRIVILPTADIHISELPKEIRKRVYTRLTWLEENAEQIIHHALVGMPSHLAGLCKLRCGDYRILYWKYPTEHLIEVFSVRHRSEVYRKLK